MSDADSVKKKKIRVGTIRFHEESEKSKNVKVFKMEDSKKGASTNAT